MLFHSNNSLLSQYRSIINNSKNAIILSPYIKREALSALLEKSQTKINSIVTTWKPIDIAIGVTDIEVYEFCKINNIQLLINNRIHLKSIILDDFSSCTISSSNITKNGLALNNNFNFELGTYVEKLSIEDKFYFDSIIDNSYLVSDEVYDDLKGQVNSLAKDIEKIPQEFNSSCFYKNKYTTSKLPYSDNPTILHNIITNQGNYSEEEIRSAVHDINLYNVNMINNQEEIRNSLKVGFLNNFFIREFLDFNGDGKYFGELSLWLHDRIENIPSPKRFEVKEYLQRIFIFLDYLLKDEYEICVPHRHSQFLKRIDK